MALLFENKPTTVSTRTVLKAFRDAGATCYKTRVRRGGSRSYTQVYVCNGKNIRAVIIPDEKTIEIRLPGEIRLAYLYVFDPDHPRSGEYDPEEILDIRFEKPNYKKVYLDASSPGAWYLGADLVIVYDYSDYDKAVKVFKVADERDLGFAITNLKGEFKPYMDGEPVDLDRWYEVLEKVIERGD